MNNKKSQFEVIGLLVIVIFISLAVLFVVQFILSKESSFIKEEHKESQFALNLLNVFIETTANDCYNLNMDSLLDDCVSNWGIPVSMVQCENLQTSCEYLKNTANQLLERTLKNNGKSYIFSISGSNPEMDYVELEGNVENCFDESWWRRKESKTLPLKIDKKEIDISILICMQ